MNSIIDFIKTNWIWLVVIVLITIITIIGFLADKKKSPKKQEIKDKTDPNNTENGAPQNIGTPTTEPLNNGFGLNIGNMDTTIRPISENDNGMSNNINLNNNVNGIEAITPFNNNQINNPNNIVTPNANLNNSYQKPITNFESNLNNQEMFGNNVAAPQQSQNIYSNTIQPIPETTNYVEQPYQQVNNNILPQNPMSNPYSSINAQNTMNSFMDMGNMQNYNQNNTTIPTPVNQIPTPQPVTPQPIMNGINNNTQMMNQNYGNNMANQQMNQNMPSTEQPGMITNSNIPVNFVFGPQNNNQNM